MKWLTTSVIGSDGRHNKQAWPTDDILQQIYVDTNEVKDSHHHRLGNSQVKRDKKIDDNVGMQSEKTITVTGVSSAYSY